MTLTSSADSREDLVLDYDAWQREILDCDPSESEYAQAWFITLQGEESDFRARAVALGFADLDALAEYVEGLGN